MAEYEHQFKAIDEAQKVFVEREMMPKDIKREFLTGPRQFDEIMEIREVIVNEMLADDGPVPMDLRNVGAYDSKMTHSAPDTSNDMSYEDVCAIAWKRYKAGKGAGKKGPSGSGTGIVEKELMNGRVAEEMTEATKEARRAPRAANVMGTATRTREALEAKEMARVMARAERNPILLRLRRATAYRHKLSIQVHQQHKRRRR